MAQRLSSKAVYEAIEEAIADGQLGSDPLAYTGGNIGHGTRYVFRDGFVALGPKEAMQHLVSIMDNEHLGSK